MQSRARVALKGSLMSERGRDEGVRRCSGGDRGHKLRCMCEGIVVIGDGIVIATLKRPDLRPAAVRKLCRE
jgi:hypothetical protein